MSNLMIVQGNVNCITDAQGRILFEYNDDCTNIISNIYDDNGNIVFIMNAKNKDGMINIVQTECTYNEYNKYTKIIISNYTMSDGPDNDIVLTSFKCDEAIYDELHRCIKETLGDGSFIIYTKFDSSNNPIKAYTINSYGVINNVIECKYDDKNHCILYKNNDYSIIKEFDDNGNEILKISDDTIIMNKYDDKNRLVQSKYFYALGKDTYKYNDDDSINAIRKDNVDSNTLSTYTYQVIDKE